MMCLFFLLSLWIIDKQSVEIYFLHLFYLFIHIDTHTHSLLAINPVACFLLCFGSSVWRGPKDKKNRYTKNCANRTMKTLKWMNFLVLISLFFGSSGFLCFPFSLFSNFISRCVFLNLQLHVVLPLFSSLSP